MNKKIVLFVDDDPISQMNVKILFRNLEKDFELHVFTKGEELIEKLLEINECFAVICDLHLKSRINGAAVLAKSREISPSSRLALLSNTPRAVVTDLIGDISFDVYLDAPIELPELLDFLS
jgi:CheY-like chemotaxis protein